MGAGASAPGSVNSSLKFYTLRQEVCERLAGVILTAKRTQSESLAIAAKQDFEETSAVMSVHSYLWWAWQSNLPSPPSSHREDNAPRSCFIFSDKFAIFLIVRVDNLFFVLFSAVFFDFLTRVLYAIAIE